MNITIRELLAMDIEIDCYDDVCEELAIAFCGPMILTDEGVRKFGAILDCPVELGKEYAIIHVDDADDSVWEARLKKVKRLFYAMAGYCAESDYDRWFEDVSLAYEGKDGMMRCGGCNGELIRNSNGDMPARCPRCKSYLSYIFWKEQENEHQ